MEKFEKKFKNRFKNKNVKNNSDVITSSSRDCCGIVRGLKIRIKIIIIIIIIIIHIIIIIIIITIIIFCTINILIISSYLLFLQRLSPSREVGFHQLRCRHEFYFTLQIQTKKTIFLLFSERNERFSLGFNF